MGIVQEVRKDNRDMKGLTFAELAHTPFVRQPDSIEGITEEWFSKQSDIIEQKIAAYEKSITSASAREWEVRKLRNLIERLRKFTTEVLTDRARRESSQKPAAPPSPQINPYQEMAEAQAKHEAYVEELIKKNRQLNNIWY